MTTISTQPLKGGGNSAMSKIYDFVIIGSGPAGSVIAKRLCEEGASCLLLEAGQDFKAEEYPENELNANSRLLWNGGMDANRNADMLFLRGKAVGGGSVVNQCLLDRFDDIAWDSWQQATGIDWFNQQSMANYYQQVESDLSLHEMQRQDWNRNAELYVESFEKCGYQWAPLRRGQADCGKGNDCMRCLGGCPRESKQSMPVTYLRRAIAAGLDVQAGFEVNSVIEGQHFVSICGQQQVAGTVKKTFKSAVVYARHCVLAAGALGTTKLLLNSGYGDAVAGLGKNFYCHPQFMTLARMAEVVDAHKGAFQAVKSNDPRFREQGFKLENVFAGPIAVAMLKSGSGKQHQRFMQNYRHLACMEVAIRDVNPGTISTGKDGRLKIEKVLGEEDRQRARAGNDVVGALFESVGALETLQSPLKIGLHLMGGCAIGKKGAVVDERFQLQGSSRLRVVDSSIFPNAPGINPSLTIMALAHRAADEILQHAGSSLSTAMASNQAQSASAKPSNVEVSV
jgi:choline dehydrogenase-like flavoprotein